MWFFHYLIYFLKQICIAKSYLIEGINDGDEMLKLIRTKLFTVQMVDYISLCYILEALAAKNIVQIGLYIYMLLYSIVMDVITSYVNYTFNPNDKDVLYCIVFHVGFVAMEIFFTIAEIGIFEDEFSLRYFKRFGASIDLNNAYSIREDLKICMRFTLFSQYITIVHYFLDVYIDNKPIIILMFIIQTQTAIVNASFLIFRKKENKRIRQFQIINLLISIFLRFLQLLIASTDAVQVERYNFYSISFVELIILIITTYISYVDYNNFGKGLLKLK
ncbi:hypothetical protein NGRA_1551 [Nosema granulosis]|uniref:Uncharacterized protein n=1 Tax=Nosema granulosis TaxID=83296 RepID=A0A9P6GY93_9MICR|nr:hypothetical protein NGRA_1551 [Nosema granulosis]